MYNLDGIFVDKEIDFRVEFIFNRLLDKVIELRKIMGGFVNDIFLGFVLDIF